MTGPCEPSAPPATAPWRFHRRGRSLEPAMSFCDCQRPIINADGLTCALCSGDSVAALEAASKAKT